MASTVWLVYWSVLFVATHIPIDERLASRIPVSDLVMHALAYGLLAGLGGWRILHSRPKSLGWAVVFWGCWYAAYGFFDEWLQQFTGRNTSLYDWLADVTGVAIASVLVVLWSRIRQHP